MMDLSRRAQLKNLLGAAGAALLPACSTAPAATAPVPPEGVGSRIRHLGHSDQGGRPDAVQVMVNRGHAYVGHLFNNGITTIDASDPRKLKVVNHWSLGAGDFTRTAQMNAVNDILLVANGANTTAMSGYNSQRSYFENNLADTITQRRPFRAGISVHDISRPAQMREIAFLEIPGFGVNRLWWTGERYAYAAAHVDGYTDHVLCVIDMANITKPEVVARWALPGMNRAAGEAPALPPGRRAALHHMLTDGNRGYAAWRDGGMTVHDLSDPANPKLLSHVNWSPPFPGGTHTTLPLPRRNLVAVAHEANAQGCAKGFFPTFLVDVRDPRNPVPISTLPTATERDYCALPGIYGPHNLHENRPGSYQSVDTLFATCCNAGLRVYDIRNAFAPKEIAYWIPPAPTRMADPRPNIPMAPQMADLYVTPAGLIFTTDWNAGLNVLECQG